MLKSNWSCTLWEKEGAAVQLKFNKPIPKSARILISGCLRKEAAQNSDSIFNIPLTVASISQSTGRGCLTQFAYCKQFGGSATNFTAVRLAVAGVTMSGSNVSALTVTVEVANLDGNDQSTVYLDVYTDIN